MLNKVTSIRLSRPSPCDVPEGYASVGGLSAALLPGPFEHPSGNRPHSSPAALWPCWMTLLGIWWYKVFVREEYTRDFLR
mgnify:CR=1 FL=1